MSNGEQVEDIYPGRSNLGDEMVVFKILRSDRGISLF